MINAPDFIPMPFANSGTANTIPTTQPAPSALTAASWTDGFPLITQTPLASGGVAPARGDFNGVLKSISSHTVWQQSGNLYGWSADLDYAARARVIGSNGQEYLAIAASGPNTTAGAQNPVNDTAGAYWFDITWLVSPFSIPVATVIISVVSTNPPDGWLDCNGQAVSRTTYSALFDAIGTHYGEGDGSSTFNLPDFTDRTPWGGMPAADNYYKTPGLPDISAKWGGNYWEADNATNEGAAWTSWNQSGTAPQMQTTAAYHTGWLNFRAGRANAIYGAANTVRTPSVVVRFFIKY